MEFPRPVSLVSPFAGAPSDLLVAILDQSPDCIKMVSSEGTIEYMNFNGQRAMEIDDFYTVAGKSWTQLWPSDATVLIKRALEGARRGETVRFDAYCPTARGSPRWWEVRVSPLHRLYGQANGFVAISRDISQRIKLAAQLAVTQDAMRHRLRTNHLVLGSIAARSSANPEAAALTDLIGDRLGKLNSAQSAPSNASVPWRLADLTAALLQPYAAPDCPFVIGALPAIELGQAELDTLGLVLCELAVNSIRHGALGTAGRITLDGRLNDGQIELHWSERSERPHDKRRKRRGQGHALLSRALELRTGSIELRWVADGLDAIVRLGKD